MESVDADDEVLDLCLEGGKGRFVRKEGLTLVGGENLVRVVMGVTVRTC